MADNITNRLNHIIEIIIITQCKISYVILQTNLVNIIRRPRQ